MDPKRKAWNKEQQELQKALEKMEDATRTVKIFLDHHAAVHSSRLTERSDWSFEDEALEGLQEADFRIIPGNEEHSIAWVLWHLARIEDVTMNILVGGRTQVFMESNFKQKIGFDSADTGNALDQNEIRKLSGCVEIAALREYRVSVGKRTREIVDSLEPGEFGKKVDPAHLERIMAEGAVVESTRWLLDYWSKKTIGSLLLMPPTRHNFVHLNEALVLKKKILKQPII